ncbi:MAG: hypothetical protein GKS00_10085 [Alphaproteobacteria bacterium]|nr:hypothetical protein [Alphaproteobacteria bacterium]
MLRSTVEQGFLDTSTRLFLVRRAAQHGIMCMKLGRRLFLGLGAGSAVFAWVRGAAAAVIGPSGASAYPLTAFPHFLDTLIPRDETGSATDFGIDRRIIDKASRSKRYMRLLRSGCQWLDLEARKVGGGGFAGLDPATQEAIVTRAAEARPRSLPRVFFDVARSDAMRAYYANPASWKTLGYKGPPQPEGFMDHAEAPR